MLRETTMENTEVLRKELYEMYRNWNQKIFASDILTQKDISLPYYIYLPDNWTTSKTRILVVGEEGYG